MMHNSHFGKLWIGNKGGLLRLWLQLAVLCMMSFPLLAQEQFGSITGLVTDPSGAIVPGATVIVSNEYTRASYRIMTNTEGYYTVTSLIPGTYDISVSMAGFAPVTRAGTTLDVAQKARVDIALAVGQLSQRVEVTATGPLLQTESATVGTTIPDRDVDQLPLNGRNYLTLVQLVPGAVVDSIGFDFAVPVNSVEVNGMRDSATNYFIDGANVQFQCNGGESISPAPDAIQEITVMTNDMSARFGGGGSVINAVLKSGTNTFHGNAYDYLRNDVLDGRNFFALGRTPLKRNQFGATFGGPIKKEKTFFFVDYQGLRDHEAETADSPVPTAAERAGIFPGAIQNPYTGQPFPNNQINIPLSPQATFFLPLVPLPNTSAGTYIQSGVNTLSSDQFDIRLDQQIKTSHRLAFTYGVQQGSEFTAGSFPDNGATTGSYRTQFGNIEWIWNATPNIVNSFHITHQRITGPSTGQGIGTNLTEEAGIQGFELTSLVAPGPPGISVAGIGTGYWGGGLVAGYPFYPLNIMDGQDGGGDVVTWMKGKHTVELGVDYRTHWNAGWNPAWSRGFFNFTGTYTGNGFADYLLGLPFSANRSFARDDMIEFFNNQDVFAQDSWKVSRRLTVTGGLRWDIIHPMTETNNLLASTNPYLNTITLASTRSGYVNTTYLSAERLLYPIYASRVIPGSEVGLPNSLVHMDDHAFAPRLGLAYQVGHGFVLRAGYGVFYTLNATNQIFSNLEVNPPLLQDQLGITNTTPVPTKTFATMFLPLTTANLANIGPASFNQADPWMTDPYIQEWNFFVQKVVGGVVSVEAGYVGSEGKKLTFSNQDNIPLPGPGGIQDRRPNPFFGSGNLTTSAGLSHYNALQATVQTRNWHGLYLLAAYTWAKSMDNVSADDQASPVQDYQNIRSEWGISDFNVPSRFVLSSTYNMPFLRNRHDWVSSIVGGWAMSNIITLQTGHPFTPSIETDPANTGTPTRPMRLGSGILSNPTINKWFDYAAFAPATCYCYGDTARNILNGPPLHNWDFSLFKDFDMSRFREGMRMQFRGEFFNFTNTPAFANPNTDVQAGPGVSGAIFSAGAPREIQFALKFYF